MWSPPAGGSVYPVAEASASVTVRKVRCIHTGSGSASANVIKNYRGTPSDILSSDLTSANTWQNSAAAGGGVALSEGDEIDVELVGVAGYVEQIVVQIDYEEVV